MTKPKYVVVDVETSGLDWTLDKLHGVAVACEEDDAKYFPAWAIPDLIKRLLADPKIAKVGHNFHAFDAKFLIAAGLEVNGNIHDTMILGQLAYGPQSLGLKYLATKFIGAESLEKKQRLDRYLKEAGCRNIAELCNRDLNDPAHPHQQIIAEYCEEDANNTFKLFHIFGKKLRELDQTLRAKFGFKKTPLDYYQEEAMPLERVLLDMEMRGIRVNLDVITGLRAEAQANIERLETELSAHFPTQIAALEEKLYQTALAKVVTDKARAKLAPGKGKCAFSWGNNNHIADLLFVQVGIPTKLHKHTKQGKIRTDKTFFAEVAKALPKDHPLKGVFPLLAALKKEQKIASTYTGTNKKGILSKVRYKDGTPVIYPTYRQTTSTGRLACKNPNMQNLKRNSPVKKFFRPMSDTGVFDHLDYSQIELRIAAHESQDRKLMQAYIAGQDVHCQTATTIYGREIGKKDDLERQVGKRTNFLTIYKGSPPRLQESLLQDTGVEFSKEDCKRFIAAFFELYQGYAAYLESQLAFVKRYKFVISAAGRIRRLPDIVYGEGLKWVKKNEYEWAPLFNGKTELRLKLIARLKEMNKRRPNYKPSNEEIGLLAHRKYSHAVKQAYNDPIQGLGASMTKRAMIALHKRGFVIANQVHDSLSIEREQTNTQQTAEVTRIMESVYPLSVPVKTDCKSLPTFD